ncbi:apolipoprotein N-acyltransferase [Nisaea acidiphila]|uniref:Apolipoprotein N-acyltransferase n=1 Tax=Nisaea acidiphila TaxID=1862145 RepID=A0A9J7B0X7_9PROT|nr:apolipoprotein N-acyltransferase [Nisaea acidiphila]UUX52124.1 apolipoprotein N-acyltransferase [Nisaea acidiphila]
MSTAAAAARLGAGARTSINRLAALTGIRNLAVMAASGAVAALALPPFGLLPAIFAFAPLMLSVERRQSWGGAFATGWAFAFGHHVAGLYWISNALLVDGDRFAWAVPFAAAGLPAGLALYGGLAALLYFRLQPRGWLRAPAFAGAWSLAEILRGTVATGFPWNLPASAWTFSDALMQPLALFGAYGYGFFVLLFAFSPLMLLRRGSGRTERWVGAGCLLLPVVFAGYGVWRLDSASEPDASAPTVRVVQGNVPQRDKWKPDMLRGHLAKYAMLTRLGRADAMPAGIAELPPPRLVVWPETAVPYALNREPELAAYLGSLLRVPGGLLMTGAPLREPVGGDANKSRNFNAVVSLDPAGAMAARHDKFHLVPFGEYVPFSEWLPLGPVVRTGSGFTAGTGPGSFAYPGLPRIGALICYEVIFPGAVTASGGPRPELLVNVTNDAWFGASSGPYQHLAAARMRAVEEGIPVIRAANTGISAVIDAYGRIRVSLPLEETGTIDSSLPAALPSKTPYARVRNSTAILLGFLPLLAVFLRRSV